ncbi:MAG: hypothetical protein HYW47_02805 [Deltaproteobacteria bacterium]|nr:hypothetical protein [Deltaproteobacteria bacterium]
MSGIFVILLISFFLLSACSHSVEKKEAKLLVQNIKIGETTQKEIQDIFGNPAYFGGRGKKTWWYYAWVKEIGFKSLSLYFDEDARVNDYYFTPQQ